MNCRKKNEKIQYFWGTKKWVQSEMGKGKVIHDRVWNRKKLFWICSLLEWGTSTVGNSNENKKSPNKHISVAGKCKITLNLQVTLDIPYLIGRMAGISQ